MQEVLQNDEKFSKVDRETVEAINLFAGTDIDIDEKEEVIDMCKAWEEQKNEGRELGREEGRELGERQKIISQIVKKLQKDKSVAEIADDLEEKEEVIAPIYEAALSMKPDYDVEKIYELLEKNKKLA
jgi:predicted transposase YdaD